MVNKKNLIISIIICLVLVSFVPIKVNAASSKKAFYYSCCAGPEWSSGMHLNITRIVKKGKKIKVNGTVAKAKSFSAYLDHKYSTLRNRTFSVSNDCKYYTAGGDGVKHKISQKKFIKMVNDDSNMPHLTVAFKTNSKGKIYYMMLDTSM